MRRVNNVDRQSPLNFPHCGRGRRGPRLYEADPDRDDGGLTKPIIDRIGIFGQRGRSVEKEVLVPTRNVVLTERQEALIEALVASGRYQNASEVLRDGLRLVEAREAEEAVRLEALREAVRAGETAFDRGDHRTFSTVDDLARHLEAIAELAMTRADPA